MSRRLPGPVGLLLLLAVLAIACGPGQTAQPTSSPAPAAKATEAPKPAAQASPATSPSPSPAASPAGGVSPAAKPVAVPPRPADFPTGALQFWVGFPAGGSSDIGARILAAAMEKTLGQPVTVVNKPGGSGQVAWNELVRTRPDAGVMALVSVPQLQTIIIDPERQAAFKLDDFTPIANQVLDPGAVFVAKNSPYKTIEALVEAARQNPRQLKIGDTGIASDDHLAILDLARSAGVEFRIVHFEGGTPATTAVLGGQVDAVFDNVGQWVSKVKSGDGDVLAVTAERRSEFLRDVPTMKAKGWPVISSSARGIVGSPGMKQDHVRYLSAVVGAAMTTPDVKDNMDEVGLGQQYMDPEEYKRFLEEQLQYAQGLFQLIEEERKET